MAGDLWRRITVTYAGHGPDGTAIPVRDGGYVGTIAAAAGFTIHKIAGWLGWNQTLARMRMPFRI